MTQKSQIKNYLSKGGKDTFLVSVSQRKQRIICYHTHFEDEESKKPKLSRFCKAQVDLVLNIRGTSWEHNPTHGEVPLTGITLMTCLSFFLIASKSTSPGFDISYSELGLPTLTMNQVNAP